MTGYEWAILWTVLIVVFIVVEIITVGLTSIWFAGGALAALICCALGASPVLQFVVFVVVSVILLAFTRPWALKYFKPRLTKTNYEDAVGKKVCLTEDVNNILGTGTAILNGQEWTARAYQEDVTFESGEIALVKEVRGVTLYLIKDEEPVKEEVKTQKTAQ